MKGIIAGISTLINSIKMIFEFIGSIISTIAMVFKYLLEIVNLVFEVIPAFPSWLMAFAVITACISIAYFVIGRNAGKSD